MEAAARNLEMILRPIVEPTGLDTRDEHLAPPPPPKPLTPYRCHFEDYRQQGEENRQRQEEVKELVNEVVAIRAANDDERDFRLRVQALLERSLPRSGLPSTAGSSHDGGPHPRAIIPALEDHTPQAVESSAP